MIVKALIQRPQLILIFSCFMLLAGCTSPMPDLQTMLQNASNSYPNIWRLVTATSYVMGFLLIFKGVYSLKVYGEARTMMAVQGNFKAVLITFVAGAALIYSPTAFHLIMLTTFGTANPLSYTGNISGWSPASTQALIGFIQIVGLLAFIRGWFYIIRGGSMSAQPGMFGKGLTHILGGVLAINIVGTVQVLHNTFFV